jgi:hypothetical protein
MPVIIPGDEIVISRPRSVIAVRILLDAWCSALTGSGIRARRGGGSISAELTDFQKYPELLLADSDFEARPFSISGIFTCWHFQLTCDLEDKT